jgi:hypothetical protein
MSNVRFGMQEVESLEEVSHHRLHKLFVKWARFATWSLEREQCGLERQMDQTLVKITTGTFEGEHIDGMTDVLGSRMRCGYRIEMVVEGDLAIHFPRRSTHVHLKCNILVIARSLMSRSHRRDSKLSEPCERSRQNHAVEFAPNPSLPITR